MENNNQHTIWTNEPDAITALMEDYNAEYGDEDEQLDYYAAAELNDEYRHDEISNLESANAGEILAIADLGLWNGRCSGYTTYKKLTDVLETMPNYDAYIRFYVDEHGEFCGRFTHHDGINSVIYRERRPNCSEEMWNHLLETMMEDDDYSNLVELCTMPLGTKIQAIYGWVDPA